MLQLQQPHPPLSQALPSWIAQSKMVAPRRVMRRRRWRHPEYPCAQFGNHCRMPTDYLVIIVPTQKAKLTTSCYTDISVWIKQDLVLSTEAPFSNTFRHTAGLSVRKRGADFQGCTQELLYHHCKKSFKKNHSFVWSSLGLRKLAFSEKRIKYLRIFRAGVAIFKLVGCMCPLQA